MSQAEKQIVLSRALYDVAAVHSAILVVVGERLGLYRTLGEGGATPFELAARTGVDLNYVEAWLINQAASGYISRNGERFEVSDAQREVLSGEAGVDIAAAFELALLVARPDRLEAAFRGDAMVAREFNGRVKAALARMSEATHRKSLFAEWLPAVDGLVSRLEDGIQVLEIGCGFGTATIAMAARFPRSTFRAVDFDGESIVEAQRRSSGMPNVEFRVEDAVSAAGSFDLITSFEMLHDAADPRAVARHVETILAPGGRWLIVEPRLVDDVDELMNPYGRWLAALSATFCIPSVRAAGGDGLGMIINRDQYYAVLRDAGLEPHEVPSQSAAVLDVRRRSGESL